MFRTSGRCGWELRPTKCGGNRCLHKSAVNPRRRPLTRRRSGTASAKPCEEKRPGDWLRMGGIFWPKPPKSAQARCATSRCTRPASAPTFKGASWRPFNSWISQSPKAPSRVALQRRKKEQTHHTKSNNVPPPSSSLSGQTMTGSRFSRSESCGNRLRQLIPERC